ncbi:MAG: hypothetical protein AB8B64_23215 [Granulosicoccus sp.]
MSATQTDSSNAVDAISDMDTIVEQINDIQELIVIAVQQQSDTTDDISRTITSTANGSSDIAENISQVAKGTQLTIEGAAITKSTTDELSRTSVELHKMVNRFKIDSLG